MFAAAIRKEFILIFRDLHSLLVLFVMPAVFIVIMSLAMQRQFEGHNAVVFNAVVVDYDGSDSSKQLVSLLNDVPLLDVSMGSSNVAPVDELLRQDKIHLSLSIPKGFSQNFIEDAEVTYPIVARLAPSVNQPTKLLITAAIREAYAKTRLNLFIASLEPEAQEGGQMEDIVSADAIIMEYAFGEEKSKPSAVQQSVPAWLVFAMFFVVIPVSTTLINERQLGTLSRLKTMVVSPTAFLLSKIAPYLVINQIQLAVMLLIGVYLVPLLGGDQLTLGDSYLGIILLSLAVGIAAMGFALLIAVVSKTTEQATSLGGVGNILCGALGGIMVPKFIMPDSLQLLSNLSPMSWGLEGFLDLFLRKGGVASILPEVGVLLAFGVITLVVALQIFNKGSTSSG